MKNFWTFYQNMGPLAHPFRVFGLAHLTYLLLTCGAIFLVMRDYIRRDEAGKRRWQKGVGAFLLAQELFFYGWICLNCREGLASQLVNLELCTFCVFFGASTMFHENKQVRFFSAVVGLIGAPIAMVYPATVADIYPAFSYRLIQFSLSHGALVLFSLMMLSDRTLLNGRRLRKNLLIVALLLGAVYCVNLRFGTQYMFVGDPPEIGMIRLVYDLVGRAAFLPVAMVILSGYQILIYFVSKKIQGLLYPKERNAR